jgi:hypothetical protein
MVFRYHGRFSGAYLHHGIQERRCIRANFEDLLPGFGKLANAPKRL